MGGASTGPAVLLFTPYALSLVRDSKLPRISFGISAADVSVVGPAAESAWESALHIVVLSDDSFSEALQSQFIRHL